MFKHKHSHTQKSNKNIICILICVCICLNVIYIVLSGTYIEKKSDKKKIFVVVSLGFSVCEFEIYCLIDQFTSIEENKKKNIDR